MWIRSQSNFMVKPVKVLIEGNKLIRCYSGNCDNSDLLGFYSPRKRCQEVFEEIQMAIINDKKVFQMPEK